MKAANTPSLLQHPFHKHALIFQELSESFRFQCQICHFFAKGGPAYHCIEYCGFFIHKSCAELPPEIQHPSHPQHPLALICSRKECFCRGCEDSIHYECRYQCDSCQVNLHVGCAAATLPPPEAEHKEEQEHEEEIIQHFAHEHPLASFQVNAPNCIRCKACKWQISGRVYGCRACIFVLHESCALAPREIMNHPLHPQHQLVRGDLKVWVDCKVCGTLCRFAYSCNECHVNLDDKCAVSIVRPPPRDHDRSRSTDDRRDRIHHFSHPHQLTSFHAKKELEATCNICWEKISGDFYCCPGCLFLLHQSCAELAQEIVHRLHPDHTLICQPGCHESRECSFCSSFVHKGFKCKECLLGLHVGCALQTLSATKEELTLKSEFLHKHPMRLRFLTEGHNYETRSIVCCEGPVEGLVYVCTEYDCRMMIHKRCAGIPRESEHPIHPQHPLLLSSEPLDKSNPCSACLGSSRRFTYYCDYCKIQFHANCAMRRPTLKHPRHEHSLSYFEKIGRELYRAQCNVCDDDCRIDFYRCVPCNYNLHFNCLPLPPSAKHEFHFHPLVLRDRVVDEHYDYAEQYCDVCEKLRNPELGVYYCEECNYAADIDCVIPKLQVDPEKSRQMEDLMLKQLDGQISRQEGEIEALKKKLESSMKILEEFKKKRQEISSSQVHREAESDRGR